MTYSDDRRADLAKGLIDNPILNEALGRVEAEALDRALAARNDEARIRHLAEIAAVRALRETITEYVSVHTVNVNFDGESHE